MQGKTIDGYTLKTLLGVGGMAEVWLAENALGKKAAVKLLLPKFCNDEAIVARFENEAKVMVQLDHPNIRQVYDYGNIDGRPCIVMEYLEGNDLKALMKSGRRFTDAELRKWWNQIADALNYTHAEGIVHRDIKPSNIFLDKKGNIKLLDFGIAKIRESISMTQTGATMGTLMYMSPEQVRDSKYIGPKSDVYSLAVSFVHLLSGKKPYDSDTTSDYDIRKGIVEIPLDLTGVPAEWQGFLKPYLEKDPAKRPALKYFEPKTCQTSANMVESDDEGTIVNDAPKKQEPQRQEPKKAQPMAKTEPMVEGDNPKSKKGLWIGLGVAVVAAIAAFLLFRQPQQASLPTDPDTQAYQACQTAEDYRTYMCEYGSDALHYADAKAFVDQYVADSAARAQELIDQQQAEVEAQSAKDEEAAENKMYNAIRTVADCNAYLRKYPNGRFVDQVKQKKNEFEDDEAFAKCKTIKDCDSYLSKYKDGRHVRDVQQLKVQLEKQQTQHGGNGSVGGHDYVDLGLLSGTLWATCNVGAIKPEGYGSYYAWGETATKSTYSWSNYKYANADFTKLTKYCYESQYGNNGFTDGLTTLQAGDDPVSSWGSGWRMPSNEQWDELLKNTTNIWTVQNGVKGRLFMAKNGQTLFLPASGYQQDSKLNKNGSGGYYWLRSLGLVVPYYSQYIHFNSDDCFMNVESRSRGFSVRPVRQK